MFKSRKAHAALCATSFRFHPEEQRSAIQIDRLMPVALVLIFSVFAAVYLAI